MSKCLATVNVKLVAHVWFYGSGDGITAVSVVELKDCAAGIAEQISAINLGFA